MTTCALAVPLLVAPFGLAQDASPADRPAKTANWQNMLRTEADNVRRQVVELRANQDKLRAELELVDDLDSELKRHAEVLARLRDRCLAERVEVERLQATLDRLAQLSPAHRMQALITASPDELLTQLLAKRQERLQSLAGLREVLGKDHPERRRAEHELEVTERQIQDRVDGIIDGMGIRLHATKAGLKLQEEEMANRRKASLDRAKRREDWLGVQRDLDMTNARARELDHELRKIRLEESLQR